MRAISDTTNSAKLASRILDQGRSPVNGRLCVMHISELIQKHAVGAQQRRKNNQIIDKFEEADIVRNKVRGASAYIMDRKAKGRFKDYVKCCEKHFDTQPPKLLCPGVTRVSGIHLNYRSHLRHKSLLQIFSKKLQRQNIPNCSNLN